VSTGLDLRQLSLEGRMGGAPQCNFLMLANLSRLSWHLKELPFLHRFDRPSDKSNTRPPGFVYKPLNDDQVKGGDHDQNGIHIDLIA
jgi:hypothetical protein